MGDEIPFQQPRSAKRDENQSKTVEGGGAVPRQEHPKSWKTGDVEIAAEERVYDEEHGAKA